MHKKNSSLISNRQFIFLIHGAQMGIGILQLPRLLAEKADMDGWISLISGWLMSVLASLIIVQIMKKNPHDTLLDLLTMYFGKWFGKIGAIALFLYFLFMSFVVIQKSILYIRVWIIPESTEYILMLLISVPIYIIARNGIKVIGRYAELIFFITIWIFLFYIFALKQSHHWEHILPLFKNITQPILNTPSTAAMSFLGFEIIFLLYPFLEKKQDAARGIIIANSITLILFLYITISCFVFFSPNEITQYNEPTLSMLKIIEFRFLERVEIIFLALYIFVVSTTWIPYIYCSTFCMSWLGVSRNYSKYLKFILLLFIVLFYFIPSTLYQNALLQRMGAKIGLVIAYILPLVLFIYSNVYNRIHRRNVK
ncbi:GerAB/ArcD/ProY family transporter [Bacillus cereus]|uniref:Spore gernimation protein n=1 Tax=Bacillus cereus TaxID=1396 RepID=A0A2A9A2Y0_BACCE|nr:endospore germination permease [Bacillus cereus]PFE15274.1 spore gernimation protein [Bacillus cereus]